MLCQCGNGRESHLPVALGDFFSTAIVNHWDSSQHSSPYPTDAFGEMQFAGASKRQSYVGTRLSGATRLSDWRVTVHVCLSVLRGTWLSGAACLS